MTPAKHVLSGVEGTQSAKVLQIPLFSPEAVKKIHSWFESLTTNGFQVPSFKQLAVRPELRRRATAIFSQLPLCQRGMKEGFLDFLFILASLKFYLRGESDEN